MRDFKIVQYIKAHGLEKTVKDFSLIKKDYGHKYLLKYDSINSPLGVPEVQECRGIILDAETHNVISMGYRKFFNEKEGHADVINYDNAKIFKKLDGTFIAKYFDPITDKWETGTTGSADGAGEITDFHIGDNMETKTFHDLFTYALSETQKADDEFNHYQNPFGDETSIPLTQHTYVEEYIWMFELCTPFNIIVTPHTESRVWLTGCRSRLTMKEVSLDSNIVRGFCEMFNIPVCPHYTFDINDVEELHAMARELPFDDEGYVVVEETGNDFKRVKIKSPAYNAAHHLKTKQAEWQIVDIVTTNEIDEYLTTAPERTDQIMNLKKAYDEVVNNLNIAKTELLNSQEYATFQAKVETLRNAGLDPKKARTGKNRGVIARYIKDLVNTYNLKPYIKFFFDIIDETGDDPKYYLKDYSSKKLYSILKDMCND